MSCRQRSGVVGCRVSGTTRLVRSAGMIFGATGTAGIGLPKAKKTLITR